MSSKRPPGTLSLGEAAKRIGCHYETVRAYSDADLFTVYRPLGKGTGRRGYIPADEVEAFVQGQADAVRELQKSKSKHGRKATKSSAS